MSDERTEVTGMLWDVQTDLELNYPEAYKNFRNDSLDADWSGWTLPELRIVLRFLRSVRENEQETLRSRLKTD